MSVYAANNIAKGIRRLSRQGETGLAGVICNSSGDESLEKAFLAEYSAVLGSKLVQFVPRSPVIQACEVESRTVLEHAPDSAEARVFMELAHKVMDNKGPVIPTPVEELGDLEAMYRRHLKR
jgi:nitrogenase iron protein NifH